jgi:hypothetical protein
VEDGSKGEVNVKQRDRVEDAFRRGTPIDRALKAAVIDAVAQHKRAGQPIAEWREGSVVWVAPDDIRIVPPPTKKGVNDKKGKKRAA